MSKTNVLHLTTNSAYERERAASLPPPSSENHTSHRVCTVFLQRREKKLIKTHKNTFFPETFLAVISELQTDVLQQVREMCGFQWTVT